MRAGGVVLGWRRSGLLIGAMLSVAACSWFDNEVTNPHQHVEGSADADFTVNALPVYRLVVSPVLVDSPSRLLVVSLRLAPTGEESYSFAPADLRIVLPDGQSARVFDRTRAVELLRRSTIAEADMSYLLRPGHQPGGIAEFTRSAVADMIANNLLAEGSFGGARALQGYVVIDTGTPLMSLDGASFEVTAHRIGDDAPARYAYQLTPAPAATEDP